MELEGINITKIFGIILGVILFLVIIFGSFFTVHAGERGIVFDKFTGMKQTIYDEGMHLKIPIFEKAIKMNVMVQKQEEKVSTAFIFTSL